MNPNNDSKAKVRRKKSMNSKKIILFKKKNLEQNHKEREYKRGKIR